VHVYVDRGTNRPAPLPQKLKELLTSILVAQPIRP